MPGRKGRRQQVGTAWKLESGLLPPSSRDDREEPRIANTAAVNGVTTGERKYEQRRQRGKGDDIVQGPPSLPSPSQSAKPLPPPRRTPRLVANVSPNSDQALKPPPQPPKDPRRPSAINPSRSRSAEPSSLPQTATGPSTDSSTTCTYSRSPTRPDSQQSPSPRSSSLVGRHSASLPASLNQGKRDSSDLLQEYLDSLRRSDPSARPTNPSVSDCGSSDRVLAPIGPPVRTSCVAFEYFDLPLNLLGPSAQQRSPVSGGSGEGDAIVGKSAPSLGPDGHEKNDVSGATYLSSFLEELGQSQVEGGQVVHRGDSLKISDPGICRDSRKYAPGVFQSGSTRHGDMELSPNNGPTSAHEPSPEHLCTRAVQSAAFETPVPGKGVWSDIVTGSNRTLKRLVSASPFTQVRPRNAPVTQRPDPPERWKPYCDWQASKSRGTGTWTGEGTLDNSAKRHSGDLLRIRAEKETRRRGAEATAVRSQPSEAPTSPTMDGSSSFDLSSDSMTEVLASLVEPGHSAASLAEFPGTDAVATSRGDSCCQSQESDVSLTFAEELKHIIQAFPVMNGHQSDSGEAGSPVDSADPGQISGSNLEDLHEGDTGCITDSGIDLSIFLDASHLFWMENTARSTATAAPVVPAAELGEAVRRPCHGGPAPVRRKSFRESSKVISLDALAEMLVVQDVTSSTCEPLRPETLRDEDQKYASLSRSKNCSPNTATIQGDQALEGEVVKAAELRSSREASEDHDIGPSLSLVDTGPYYSSGLLIPEGRDAARSCSFPGAPVGCSQPGAALSSSPSVAITPERAPPRRSASLPTVKAVVPSDTEYSRENLITPRNPSEEANEVEATFEKSNSQAAQRVSNTPGREDSGLNQTGILPRVVNGREGLERQFAGHSKGGSAGDSPRSVSSASSPNSSGVYCLDLSVQELLAEPLPTEQPVTDHKSRSSKARKPTRLKLFGASKSSTSSKQESSTSSPGELRATDKVVSPNYPKSQRRFSIRQRAPSRNGTEETSLSNPADAKGSASPDSHKKGALVSLPFWNRLKNNVVGHEDINSVKHAARGNLGLGSGSLDLPDTLASQRDLKTMIPPRAEIPPRTHSTKYTNSGRLPLHIEHTICRLSHLKLANADTSLVQQVLISNMLSWYMERKQNEGTLISLVSRTSGGRLSEGEESGGSPSGSNEGGEEGAKKPRSLVVWKGGRLQTRAATSGSRNRARNKHRAPSRESCERQALQVLNPSPHAMQNHVHENRVPVRTSEEAVAVPCEVALAGIPTGLFSVPSPAAVQGWLGDDDDDDDLPLGMVYAQRACLGAATPI